MNLCVRHVTIVRFRFKIPTSNLTRYKGIVFHLSVLALLQ